MTGEKENSSSGSPENTDSRSPAPITQLPQPPPAPRIEISGDGVGTGAASGGGGVFRGGDLGVGRKKRGRPRRYDYDGSVRVSYKVGLAEPSGSSNLHPLAQSGWFTGSTAGGDFTPYVLSVQAGEDVATRIFSLFHKGPQEFFILSANGEISNVTLRHLGSGFFVTYQGCFEILALTGLFKVDDADSGGGTGSTTGGLSVSLAGPDGRVIGGSVAGPLRAATPIQIVVGSFASNGYRSQRKNQHNPSLNPPSAACEPHHPATTERAIPESSASVRADLQPLPAEKHEKEVGEGPNLNEFVGIDTSEKVLEMLFGA